MARMVMAVALIAMPLGCTAILASDDLTFRDSTGCISSSSSSEDACRSQGNGPKALWSKQFGGPGNDAGYGIAYSGTDIAVVGRASGAWGMDVCPSLTSKGQDDAFYAQFASTATCTSVVGVGGVNKDVAHAVAVSESFSVMVGEVEPPGTDFPVNGTDHHAFGATINEGLLAGGLAFDGSMDSAALGVAINKEGAVVMTGHFSGDINFGCVTPGDTEVLKSVNPGSNVFVATGDEAGLCYWSRAFGDLSGGGSSKSMGVAVDSGSNIYITGNFHGKLDFPPVMPTLVSATSDPDAFVAMLQATGAPLWSQRGKCNGSATGKAVAVDSAEGSVIVVGEFTTNMQFEPCELISTTAVPAAFVAKLKTADGTCLWAKAFGEDEVHANAVAVDSSGNVVITGSVRGDIDFGGGTLSGNDPTADLFVTKFAKDGAHIWSNRYSGSGVQTGNSIAVDGDGNIAVTGEFADTLDFGNEPLQSSSTTDAFLVVFPPQ